MTERGFAWAKVLVASTVLLSVAFARPEVRVNGSNRTPQATGISPTAALPPEVRLRKLHLVRPDLIPYPIDYEVIC